MHFNDETSGAAHNTTASITTLSDGRRRLVAYFSKLRENRQFQATSRVHYNQTTLHSNKVKTSKMSSNSLVSFIINSILWARGSVARRDDPISRWRFQSMY